jgi:hypothetical protein
MLAKLIIQAMHMCGSVMGAAPLRKRRLLGGRGSLSGPRPSEKGLRDDVGEAYYPGLDCSASVRFLRDPLFADAS